MTTSALAPNCYEYGMVKEQMERERLEKLSNPEKVIEWLINWKITLEEIKKLISERVWTITIEQMSDLSNEQVGLLRKACKFDKKAWKRMQEVQKHIDLRNEFKDSEKKFFRNDDWKEYIKNEKNDIFEILENYELSWEKLYNTYNHLTKKYTIFSYDWKELKETKYSKYDSKWEIIILRNTENNYFVFLNWKDKIEIRWWDYNIITLNNWKKLLVMNNTDIYTYTIVDLDDMKVLIENEKKIDNWILSFWIDIEKNIINYSTEEPRGFKLVQKILWSKWVLKTIDLN